MPLPASMVIKLDDQPSSTTSAPSASATPRRGRADALPHGAAHRPARRGRRGGVRAPVQRRGVDKRMAEVAMHLSPAALLCDHPVVTARGGAGEVTAARWLEVGRHSPIVRAVSVPHTGKRRARIACVCGPVL